MSIINKYSVKRWLLTRKWLWNKEVFDNGTCGKNYHRYSHMIYSYCYGMGENGKDGDVNTVIKLHLEVFERDCN